ncbi:MAG: RsmD family RNA methyltransferase [Bacteroidales bacterium]|nr:RsmD family RNA methyltransferase [Bacteroidales bacterium]
MRVISGTLKGRIITVPGYFNLRPTTDLAKESLFNILNNLIDFESTTALDLFAGTGSISYELASRGCTMVTSIEKNYNHYKFILDTALALGVKDIIKPIKNDVFEFIKTSKQTYDLIFCDPPYDLKELETLPNLILKKGLLAADGLLIIEHPKSISFSSNPFFYQHKHYGSVNFSMFQTTTPE